MPREKKAAWTDEQRSAILEREASVALSAGAGCGKTYVLTERFLSHLEPSSVLDGVQTKLHQLTAITFTELAAREMRERIREACHRRLMQCPAEEVDHWRELLRELDSARITTIHSFCGSFLRSHAVEAGLDPRFKVLDQSQADTLLFELIDEEIRQRLGRWEESTLAAVVEYGIDSLRDMVATLLSRRQSIDWAKWQDATAESLASAWGQWHREAILPAVIADLRENTSFKTACTLAKKAECGHKAMRERFQSILAERELLEEIQKDPKRQSEIAGLLERLLQAAKVQGGGKAKDWAKEELYESFKNAATDLRNDIKSDYLRLAAFDSSAPETRAAAEKSLRILRLTGDINRVYEDRKKELSALDFNDLLIHARKLLLAPEHRAMRRRWADNLRLLLVDEFQDTDPLQVELIRALCDDNVTEGKLFFVGDYKQSIYRFRGADPNVFQGLRRLIPDRGQIPLSKNFRSQPAILDFVNTLFAGEFGEHYEPLHAHRPQATPLPAVEFLWAIPGENAQAANKPLEGETEPSESAHDILESLLDGVFDVVDEKNADALRRLEADRIARRIRAMLDGGETLVAAEKNEGGGDADASKARPAKMGDIAILFRALSNVQFYEEALRRYGIDYYLVGGHAFFAQQEIYDVLNLLRCVESTCDEVSLIGVLRSPFFCLMDETIFWLSRHPSGLAAGLFHETAPKELDAVQADGVRRAAATLSHLRTIKDRVPIASLLQTALERTGYDAALLAEFLGERKLANLNKLVDQARKFDASGIFGLADFITQLSEFVARQPKEALAATQSEDRDVVRLMSIHQAKGLEFPVVFVADLNQREKVSSDPIKYTDACGPMVRSSGTVTGYNLVQFLDRREDQEETLRLFYVAVTRAADYLVLSSGTKDIDSMTGVFTSLLAKHFNLITGAIRPIKKEESASEEKQDIVDEAPMMVRVTTTEPLLQNVPDALQAHRSLEKILKKSDEMASQGQGRIATAWAAIPPDPKARKQFSFSRLSGEMHFHSAGPVSLLRDENEGVGERTLDARGLGTLVHAVLADVDFANPAELDELIQLHAETHFENDGTDLSETIELLHRFIESPCAAAMAGAKTLYRELEFMLAWPPETLSAKNLPEPSPRYIQGYIDALYQDASGAWRLIDFKTNRVSPATLQSTAEKYEMQMFLYALAAEKILKQPPSEVVLHFLRTGDRWAFSWDQQARKRIVDLVNSRLP